MELNIENTKVYAEVLEQDAITQFAEAMALDCNIQGALMPDAHSGYTLPIGAVVKSLNRVFPSYVGYDIGCGMCAIKLDIVAEDLNLEELRDGILENIPIGPNKHKKISKKNIDYARKALEQMYDIIE